MTRDTKSTPPGLIIREREDKDLPALAALLEKQQPQSEYPVMWPLPWPVDSFIKRANELRGWVAEIDGEVVGHVSVTGVNEVQGGDKMSAGWEAAHGGVRNEDLRQVSVFFTELERTGSGIGHHLLATASEFALRDGYPVLDVVKHHPGPVNFYLKRGWVISEEQVAPWDATGETTVYLMYLPRKQGLAALPAVA